MENNLVGGDVFLLMGAIPVFAMHAGFAFLEVGTVREKIRSMPWSKSFRFCHVDHCHFFIGYSVAYGVDFLASASVISGGGETGDIRAAGFDVDQILLSADLCRRHSGHYFRRHCRARTLCAAIACFGCHCCGGVSVFRRHDLERQFRFSGMARRKFRCRLS